MSRSDVFNRIHVISLALCAIFLPWSTAFLSMAQMLMVLNWFVGGVVQKDMGLRARRGFLFPASLVFTSFFVLHAIGLFWTSSTGMAWGLDLVRILLPVITFGVVISGSLRLTSGELRTVLLFGAWSVIASAVVCYIAYKPSAEEYRELSIFISHIRLSLLLCLAIVLFLHYRSRTWIMIAQFAAVTWAVFMINELGSIQGFVILFAIAAVLLWRRLQVAARWVRISLRALLITVPVCIAVLSVATIENAYRAPDPASSGKGQFTAGGEAYTYDTYNPQRENGQHVWAWLAWQEVYRVWPLRSKISVHAKDAKGHEMAGTLFRYMTSRGLRKDSVGVMSLSDDEVRRVEAGITNADPTATSKVHQRFSEVLFELGQYQAYGKANGHSVTMRMEFWKAGCAIAKQNLLWGVGTGDTQLAFNEHYERTNSALAPEWRLRAHNEYLTLLITFGVIGLLWCLFSWWWPAYKLGAWRDPVFIAWAIIFCVSCLTDDTIETQAGATFFALYYALFVFAASRKITKPQAG